MGATVIHLTTLINAPIDRCFNVARDIEVHMRSTEKTNERAIAGTTTGLCELGDTITWEARHFGINQQLQVEITAFEKPYFFEDKMLRGAFKSMRHGHHFREANGKTIMEDEFEYKVPFGIFGWLFDQLVLKRYMTNFLEERNSVIKRIAEEGAGQFLKN